MKYYEENSAAMSEDDDNVDIESDVSVLRRRNHFSWISRDLSSRNSLFFFFVNNQDGDDLSADGKSRSANNQYFSQVKKHYGSRCEVQNFILFAYQWTNPYKLFSAPSWILTSNHFILFKKKIISNPFSCLILGRKTCTSQCFGAKTTRRK